MSSQVPIPTLSDQAAAAWLAFLRSHAAVTRRMNAELQEGHGLSLSEYEVLLYLSHAPGQRLRRADLAGHTLLTPSGITRLLQSLESRGYVAKDACDSDGRVVYAVLTVVGRERLKEAAQTHLEGIRRLFVDRLADEELAQLAQSLGRLADGAEGPAALAGESCAPPSAPSCAPASPEQGEENVEFAVPAARLS